MIAPLGKVSVWADVVPGMMDAAVPRPISSRASRRERLARLFMTRESNRIGSRLVGDLLDCRKRQAQGRNVRALRMAPAARAHTRHLPGLRRDVEHDVVRTRGVTG